MPTQPDLIAVVPQLILIVSAGVILLIEAFLPSVRRYIAELSLLAVVAAIWARVTLPAPGDVWGGMLRVDRVCQFVDLYIYAALFLVVWMAGPFLRRLKKESGEFFTLLLLSAVGASTMACAVDLLMVFLGLELLSIPLYVLNAYLRSAEPSVESGLKYFIMGAFASSFVVYGLALLYAGTASLDFDRLAAMIATGNFNGPFVVIGTAMVLGGLAFKLALFPFHAWAPDVYQGAPTPVTAFLSVVPKGAALIVLLRLVDAIDPATTMNHWVWVAGVIAVASQTLGNIVAIVQRDIKRMLAYSGIAHMGYALVAIIAIGEDGATGVLVYLAAYTLMNIGAFATIAVLSEREDEPHLISDLEGQGWERPLLALALSVCLFSLAGIPPFVGFTAKFVVFRAAINEGLIWLAILGVVNSLISAYYYLRVVYLMYMKPLPKRKPSFPRSWEIAAVASLASLGVVLIGLYPTPLLNAAKIAARTLLG